MYSLKMQQAFIDLVQKYEQSIVDLEYGDHLPGVKERWSTYGVMSHCPLCQACQLCNECILGPWWQGCSTDTMALLKRARGKSRRSFISALKKRLECILEIARRNGIVLER